MSDKQINSPDFPTHFPNLVQSMCQWITLHIHLQWGSLMPIDCWSRMRPLPQLIIKCSQATLFVLSRQSEQRVENRIALQAFYIHQGGYLNSRHFF